MKAPHKVKKMKPKSLAAVAGVKKIKPKSLGPVREAKKISPKSLTMAGEAKKPTAMAKKNKSASNKNTKQSLDAKLDPQSSASTQKKQSQPKKNTNKSEKSRAKSHKKELEGLRNIDPEFYEFLQANDKKLLDFNLWDSDDDNDDEEEISSTDKASKRKDVGKLKQNKKTKDHDKEDESNEDAEDSDMDVDEADDSLLHKPTANLEVASDESDFDDDGDENAEEETPDGPQKVTLNLLRQWQLQLQASNPSIDVIRKVTQAFSSALSSISADTENNAANGGAQSGNAFKVVGGGTFNAVVQLCVLHLHPAIVRFLGVAPRSNIPLHKTKKWLKVRGALRYYLTDLIHLVEQVSGANILTVLLKHLHQVAGMVASYSSLGKTILKRLIVIWSTGDETNRVLAFLCILKITRNQQVSMLHHVLKAMYLSYVRNSKFVSPNTLPGINFMRRSLIEMFALDLTVSYQHAFLYIRQLAINLRNAVILKKKDSFQAVYNWQFINSLRLWCDLLGATADKQQLQQLIYPLITIAIGVIRLIPTAQYFPLRFHCVQSIVSLCKETRTYVPILPLILEVLRSNTFNSKHSNVSMKPLQFTCILRLNKGQLSENGFRDEVIEQVCNLTLEYLAHESASLAFCDLIVPAVLAMKAYLKDCRNANYSRKIKQLLDKIQENSRFIEQERKKITFGLSELTLIQAWETQVRNKGTPLDIYYTSWVKMHEMKKRRQAAQADTVNSDYDLPKIKRSKKAGAGVSIRNEHGEVELFPSDSEDDDQDDSAVQEDEEHEIVMQKQQKIKKAKKADKKKATKTKVDVPSEDPDIDGGVDIVKDLDLDDW